MYMDQMGFFPKIIWKNKSNRITFHSEPLKATKNSIIQGILFVFCQREVIHRNDYLLPEVISKFFIHDFSKMQHSHNAITL